jgi:hypothetical protein
VIRPAIRTLLTGVLLSACIGTVAYGAQSDATRSAAEKAETIVLARLVDMFEHKGDGGIFICVDDADPRPALLEAVGNLSARKIKPCHAAIADDVRPAVPIDPESGRPGISLWIKNVKRIAADEYRIEGGYLCGIDCSEGIEFLVREKGSEWVIMFETALWIS